MITKYKVQSTKYSAFTLIELLVVISIIGILAAMMTVSFVSSQKQARDVNRKSDLTQYRNALETYANKNNGLYPVYPQSISVVDPTFCGLLGLTKCPDDPENSQSQGSYYYKYVSDSGGTEYVVYSQLENVPTTTYWVVCSNGVSGKKTGAYPTTGDCPL
jgi:general secretion pathway protein G